MTFKHANVDWTALPLMHQSTIPESYLDSMGHMNVMWYTHLFSKASVALFEQIGMGRNYMETTNAGLFALESHKRFYREVHVGQHIAIRTRVIGRSEKRFHTQHYMLLPPGQLAATAEFVAAHMDMTKRRQAPFPDAIAQRWDKLITEHASLSWAPPLCGVMGP